MSAVDLVGVKIWFFANLKALEMGMQKFILSLIVAQILPDKIYKMLLQISLDSLMCYQLYLSGQVRKSFYVDYRDLV